MNPDNQETIEARQKVLLGHLQEAERNLRAGLHQHGFGNTPRAHIERAVEHVREAYVAINENKAVRSVHQLADDLTRIEQVIDNVQRGKSQRV